MRLLALTAASAALCVFAITQIPQVLAQGTNIQTGASANQGNAEQGRSSGGASTQSNSRRQQSSSGSSERSTAGVRAEKGRARVGISAKGSEESVGKRSPTRIGANSESRENTYIKHKRAYGVARLNYEPRRHIVIKRKHAYGVALVNGEPRRHIVMRRNYPGAAVTTGETTRTTVKSGTGSNVNVHAGVRSPINRKPINRNESSSSSSSRGSSGSQSGNQSRGNTGKQPSGSPSTTTGQGNNR